MSITRRFLLAPSLARLIEKERGGHRVAEGYFPEQGDRSVFVRVNGNAGSLVLVTDGPSEPMEEHAQLPRSQAQFLVDATAGQVDYLRIELRIGTHAAWISRFIAPGPLDLISVAFEQEEQARDFQPLPWFGPEVTAEARYRNRSIAIAELPETPEVELTDLALNSLLDSLENPSSSRRSRDRALIVPRLSRSEAAPVAESEQDEEDLRIEDSVIRELASALRPQRR
jgi:CYTH domain-containing protein